MSAEVKATALQEYEHLREDKTPEGSRKRVKFLKENADAIRWQAREKSKTEPKD